jgi:WD40 repeat protein
MPAPHQDLLHSPYRGLMPYTEEDANFFFGREKLSRHIGAMLKSSRITLVYGASGVGKSSVLQAGVTHQLRAVAKQRVNDHGAPKFAPVMFHSWADDPLFDLKKQIEVDVNTLYFGSKYKAPDSVSYSRHLDDLLQVWSEAIGKRNEQHQLVNRGKLLIILDQFEEYFLYHPNESGENTFAHEFPCAVRRSDLPVNFLICIREDQLAKLDFFDDRIPHLFDSHVRIQHLNPKSAYDAIVRPIEKYNERVSKGNSVVVEPDLAKVVIDQVSQVFDIQTGGRGGIERQRAELEKQVEAPYLQLVMMRLWEEEGKIGSRRLGLQTFLTLGREESSVENLNFGQYPTIPTPKAKAAVERIVEDHLNQEMAMLRKDKGKSALEAMAKVFQYLVTPTGNKIAYPVSDLAKHTGRDDAELKDLLEAATRRQRILRRIGPLPSKPGVELYEIFHDVLAQPILEWRKQYLFDEEKDRRTGAIKQGLPAQSLRQIRLKEYELAALLARQAYVFYTREPNDVLNQIDDALREALCAPYFSNILEGHKLGDWGISAIAYNPQDPDMLASADYNGIIRLWDLRRCTSEGRSKILNGHTEGVNGLAFSLDGSVLASAGYDGTVRLWWDLDKSKWSGRILGRHDLEVLTLAFSWDGRLLGSGSSDGTIKLWNSEKGLQDVPEVASLAGHNGRVRAVAFCPCQKNAHLLASGGDDQTVRLWDIRSNACTTVLACHKDVVRSVAFSPDGEMLATGSDDRTVRLLKLENPSCGIVKVDVIGAHRDHVSSVAFSNDGQLVASGSEDQTVCLWHLTSCSDDTNPTFRYLGHNFGISAVAFSPDKRILASGSWDKTIRLWHLYPSAALPVILRGHEDNVMSVALSADGKWLASGSWDRTVKIWSLSIPNREPCLVKEYRHGDKVFSVAFDRHSEMLASGSADRTIMLWKIGSFEEEPKVIEGHLDGVSSVAFSPDGRWLVSGSWKEDASVRLWDLEHADSNSKVGGRILWKHKSAGQRGESVTSVAFSPDGSCLASGSDDGTIKLLDLRRTNGMLWDWIYNSASGDSEGISVVDPILLTGHKSRVWSIAFRPDSKMLASVGDDRTIRRWDLVQGREKPRTLKPRDVHNFWVGCVAFSPDGRKVATGSYDKTVRVWELSNFDREPIVLRGHEQSVTCVAFSSDSKRIASAGYDNTIRIWLADTGDVARIVCEEVQRNLTVSEWSSFMGSDILYEITCRNLSPDKAAFAGLLGNEGRKPKSDFEFKLAQLFEGQRRVLELIQRGTVGNEKISEEDVERFLGKPKGDEGVYYRLETLRLDGFLESTDEGGGHGAIRYGLSAEYQQYLEGELT